MAKENRLLAILALITTVIVSLFGKGLLRLIPIFSGIVVGYVAAIVMGLIICIIMMPLAYSVSDGILTGMIFYVAINMASGKLKRVTPTMFILAVLFILKYIFF